MSTRPPIAPGCRLYVASGGAVRCYVEVARTRPVRGGWAICWDGAPVGVAVDSAVRGFPGTAHRWWARAAERDRPDWMEVSG